MKKLCETADLFALGGGAYGLIEVLWRGYTHWTMAALGGILFLGLGALNRALPENVSLLMRGLIGGCIITGAEFAAGCVLNLWLGLAIWDYSNLPLNFMGQICLPFSLLWVLLSVVVVVLDDWLRYWLFGEERPHYVLFR